MSFGAKSPPMRLILSTSAAPSGSWRRFSAAPEANQSCSGATWERIAAEGEPRNKRHIKSTYASASPATDGRIVVAWFGSQGIHAYDFDGGLRWSVDLGRVDMGAYDIPAYEWGPASSPIIWNGLVIVQCDTQADSFLLATSEPSA